MKKNTLILFAFALLFVSCSSIKESDIDFASGESSGKLIALNKDSVKGSLSQPEKNPYLYYKFSESQLTDVADFFNEQSGLGLKITLNFANAGGNGEYAFGVLYPENITEKNTVSSMALTNNIVFGNCSESQKSEYSLVYSVAPTGKIPCGFFIYSTSNVELKSAKLVEPMYGFSNSDDETLFAFSSSGGKVNWDFSHLDMTGAVGVFGNELFLPCVKIHSDKENGFESLCYGQEKIQCYLQSGVETNILLPLRAFKNPFADLKFEPDTKINRALLCFESSEKIKRLKQGELPPIKTDLGLVLDWPQEKWRIGDFEFYNWSLDENVFLFDFADYKIQNEFFTRLAFFVEKTGYKGTLVSDYFVENKKSYNAHDYKADDLARFFNEVKKQNFKLNNRELLLKSLLLQNKIIYVLDDGTYGCDMKNMKCVISISRESYPATRLSLMAHEAWHGLYFSQEHFRNFVEKRFNSFDKRSLDFLIGYWQSQPSLSYDKTDDYLMKNEFMSYILQHRSNYIRGYYLQRAKWNSVVSYQKDLCDYIIETNAQYFVDESEIFEKYVKDAWGLAPGRVSLILR